MRMLAFSALLVAGCASAQSFPADNAWTEVKRFGATITDDAGDTSVGSPYRDIVGTAQAPALFISSDGTYLYFRLRVNGNPVSAGLLVNAGWGVQFDTDGNDHNFEYAAVLSGHDGSVNVYRNTGRLDSPGDAGETLLVAAPLSYHTEAVGGGPYFVDWAVPISDLNSAQFGSVSVRTPLRLVFGANSSGGATFTAGLSADIAGDEAAGSTLWHLLRSDVYYCGPLGCSTNQCDTIAHGDVNGDGSVDVVDVFFLINALFAGGPAPICGDLTGDGSVDVADVFLLINYLFADGPPPA